MHLEAPVARAGLALGAGERVFLVGFGVQVHGEIPAHPPVTPGLQFLRCSAHHDPVPLPHRQAEKLVAHGATDEVDLHAGIVAAILRQAVPGAHLLPITGRALRLGAVLGTAACAAGRLRRVLPPGCRRPGRRSCAPASPWTRSSPIRRPRRLSGNSSCLWMQVLLFCTPGARPAPHRQLPSVRRSAAVPTWSGTSLRLRSSRWSHVSGAIRSPAAPPIAGGSARRRPRVGRRAGQPGATRSSSAASLPTPHSAGSPTRCSTPCSAAMTRSWPACCSTSWLTSASTCRETRCSTRVSPPSSRRRARAAGSPSRGDAPGLC